MGPRAEALTPQQAQHSADLSQARRHLSLAPRPRHADGAAVAKADKLGDGAA